LGYDHRKPELFTELTALRKQLAGPDAAREPESGMVLNGRAIELPQPDYPAAAQQRRLMGLIVVKVEIDETGKVIKATDMCQGMPYLSEAAVAAAWKARFTPTKLSGMPVKVKGVIQYNFTRRFR
jgi:TonB family protein